MLRFTVSEIRQLRRALGAPEYIGAPRKKLHRPMLDWTDISHGSRLKLVAIWDLPHQCKDSVEASFEGLKSDGRWNSVLHFVVYSC